MQDVVAEMRKELSESRYRVAELYKPLAKRNHRLAELETQLRRNDSKSNQPHPMREGEQKNWTACCRTKSRSKNKPCASQPSTGTLELGKFTTNSNYHYSAAL